MSIEIRLKKQALPIVGGLSNPSKMPCKGTSTPPKYCNVGSKLRKVKGSVCYDFYACYGLYTFKNVQ